MFFAQDGIATAKHVTRKTVIAHAGAWKAVRIRTQTFSWDVNKAAEPRVEILSRNATILYYHWLCVGE